MAGKTGTAKKKAAPKKKEKKAKDNEDAGDEDMDDDAIQEEEAITKMDNAIYKVFKKMEDENPDMLLAWQNKSGDVKNTKTGSNVKSKIPTYYYTIYGAQAYIVARQFMYTETVIKFASVPGADAKSNKTASNNAKRDERAYDVTGVPYVWIKEAMLNMVIREYIVNKKRKVEIFDRTTSLKQGSPGNFGDFEDIIDLERSVEPAITAAVKISTDKNKQINVGIAFSNPSSRKIEVCELVDNDQYSYLEFVLQQIGAKECVMNIDNKHPDFKKLTDIMERSTIALTTVTKNTFSHDSLEQDLKVLLRADEETGDNANVIMNTLVLLDKIMTANDAVAGLISYLKLMSDANNHGYYTIAEYKTSAFMKLDAAALKALNLFHSPTDSSKTMNLYGLLEKCSSKLGRRKLAQWIRQPSIEAKVIEDRLDIVELFVGDTEFRKKVQEIFLKICPDLDSINKRLQKLRATLEDLVKIAQFVGALPQILTIFEAYDGSFISVVSQHFTNPLQIIHAELENYVKLVENAVDVDSIKKHEYLLNPGLNDELDALSREKIEYEKQIEDERKAVESELDAEDGDVVMEVSDKMGIFFKTKAKYSSTIESSKKLSFIGGQKAKSAAKFTSDTMKTLAAEYLDVKQRYLTQQEEIVREVVKTAGMSTKQIANMFAATYINIFEALADTTSSLDVLISFAEISSQQAYVRPIIKPIDDPEPEVSMKAARHPCLEVQERISTAQASQFCPNDVEMQHSKSSFLVITGPNMGGKSTYIRTIGVVTLMAQIGCFVPCDSATITIRDAILCRVGAGDAQLRGVSTFMAEMIETSTIIKTSTKNSLIIIDELGRGTSTYDGFGIAYGVSEYIIKHLHSFTLFATHFHELVTLEKQFDCVKNLHVVAKTTPTSITMLYKIEKGGSSQSFGIHVARMAGFPEEVIQVAQTKADELEQADRLVDNDKKRKREDDTVDEDEPATKKLRLAAPMKLTMADQTIQEFLLSFSRNVRFGTDDGTGMIERVRVMKRNLDEQLKSNEELKTLINLSSN